MNILKISEKEAMNLKGSGKIYMLEFEGGNGKGEMLQLHHNLRIKKYPAFMQLVDKGNKWNQNF